MDFPCKECLVYAACNSKAVWDLIHECTEFREYVKYFKLNVSKTIIYQSWEQPLSEIRNKGYL